MMSLFDSFRRAEQNFLEIFRMSTSRHQRPAEYGAGPSSSPYSSFGWQWTARNDIHLPVTESRS